MFKLLCEVWGVNCKLSSEVQKKPAIEPSAAEPEPK